MKTIKKGRPQKGWAFKAECTGSGNGGGGCGSRLLIEQRDVYKTFKSCIGGPAEEYRTFQCCECGVETDTDCVPGIVEQTKLQWQERQNSAEEREKKISAIIDRIFDALADEQEGDNVVVWSSEIHRQLKPIISDLV